MSMRSVAQVVRGDGIRMGWPWMGVGLYIVGPSLGEVLRKKPVDIRSARKEGHDRSLALIRMRCLTVRLTV